jgi:hypothetical protein
MRSLCSSVIGAQGVLRFARNRDCAHRAGLIFRAEATLAASRTVACKQSIQILAPNEEDLPISEIISMAGTIREHHAINVLSDLL